MAEKLKHDRPVRPARRGSLGAFSDREYVYAHGAAEMLNIPHADYRQLRTLLLLTRGEETRDRPSSGQAPWTRFTLADIAALRIAIDLVGGIEAFGPGRRLRLAPLRGALKSLRALGFTHPLVQVPLRLVEGKVVAAVNGLVLDPRTGQGLLSDTLTLFSKHLDDDRAALSRLRLERRALSVPRQSRSETALDLALD